jgi:hypothetical protein
VNEKNKEPLDVTDVVSINFKFKNPKKKVDVRPKGKAKDIKEDKERKEVDEELNRNRQS